jgi:hypothetical protein
VVKLKSESMLPVNAFYFTWLRDKGNRDMDSIDLLIYIMLLTRADKETLTCFPSIARICEDCRGLDRGTVIKHLEALEQKGVISIEKRLGKSSEFFMRDFAEWRKNPGY